MRIGRNSKLAKLVKPIFYIVKAVIVPNCGSMSIKGFQKPKQNVCDVVCSAAVDILTRVLLKALIPTCDVCKLSVFQVLTTSSHFLDGRIFPSLVSLT